MTVNKPEVGQIPENKEGDKKSKYRISNLEALIMTTVCFIFFDLSQVILEWLLIGFLFNWLITLIASMTMALWFWIKGAGLMRPSKLLAFFASFLVDIIPGNNFTVILGFTWTMSTVIILMITRAEDITGLSIPLTPNKAIKNVT